MSHKRDSDTWQQVRLGEICEQITDGKHGDCVDQEGSGFYFLSAKDVLDGRLVYENARQITEEDFLDTHKRTRLEPHDILFTNSGTIGRMAIVKDNDLTYRTTFQKSVAILKPRKSVVEPYFLYYLLLQENRRLTDFAGGTAQKNLLLKDFRDFPVRLPDLTIQRRIASILSAYDSLIEKSMRRIEILEQIARAVYREWFVYFRYPGHENARMVTSQFGQVPDGWRNRSMLDVDWWRLVGENAAPYQGEKFYLATADVEGIHRMKSGLPYAFNNKPSRAQKVPVARSVWFARMKDTFKVQWFCEANQEEIDQLLFSSGFVGLQAQDGFLGFLLYTVNSPEFHAEKDRFATGATQISLTNEGLSRIRCLLPTDELARRYSRLVEPMYEFIVVLQRQIVGLRTSRDLLLPKLLSGEIDLSELPITTEAVANA